MRSHSPNDLAGERVSGNPAFGALFALATSILIWFLNARRQLG